LTSLSQTLEDFLPNALMEAQSQLQKLTSPRLANNLIQAAVSLFVNDFKIVEEAIRANVELSQTIFPWSIGEAKLLLGC